MEVCSRDHGLLMFRVILPTATSVPSSGGQVWLEDRYHSIMIPGETKPNVPNIFSGGGEGRDGRCCWHGLGLKLEWHMHTMEFIH